MGDSQADEERETRRVAYMKASHLHHRCLAALGLADRSPGKIYDDMAHILTGLPVEKQVSGRDGLF